MSVQCFRQISFGMQFCVAGAVYLMVSAVAPRTLNDVSYVTGINHACDCTCQAQYFLQLQDDCLVAGALFGDVGRCLLLLRALPMTFHT